MAIGPAADSFTALSFTQALIGRCRASTDQQPARLFSFGNTTLNIIFIGQVDQYFFTDATAHRAVSGVSHDLTVYVVDYQTSGVMLPPPCWNWQQADGYGTINGLEKAYAGNFQQDTGLFTWLAYQEQVAVLWVTDLTKLPEWERSFPFRFVLHKWLENDSRYVLVHAGAVGISTGGVVLTGRSGSGKSTSTLACLNTELHYAGDDFVLIDTETRFVHSLYSMAKLNPDNLARFPHLQSIVANPDAAPDQKFQIPLYQHYPMAITAGFPLTAIILPHFTGKSDTTLRPATPADALKALAPSTMALLKADQRTFQKMTRLVVQVPLFWLDTGTDLSQIPEVILNLIQSLANSSIPAS